MENSVIKVFQAKDAIVKLAQRFSNAYIIAFFEGNTLELTDKEIEKISISSERRQSSDSKPDSP